MNEDPTFTRWRALDKPHLPIDPIDHASMFKEGHLPPGFVLLLWDNNALRGPMKFRNQVEADSYLQMQPGVQSYLVVPDPKL